MQEPITAPFAASSISASEQTIIASFPPNSRENGIKFSLHCLAIFLPVAMLPVKETLSGTSSIS